MVTFSTSGTPRVGVMLDEDKIGDLYLLSEWLSHSRLNVFSSMLDFISSGGDGLQRARDLVDRLQKGGNAYSKAIHDANMCKILAPIPRPGKIIHTTGNFVEHQKELTNVGYSGDLVHPWVSFLKRPDAVIGTNEGIIYPKVTKLLDYEIEVATIIGRRCKYVSKEDALNYVAGFTIFNDVSARDIQMEEHKHGQVNVGKNLDTFAPMGPCMTTRDMSTQEI